MNPTAALLWAACRFAPANHEVIAAIDAGANLPDAAEVALVQRVSPLLWRALRAAGVDTNGAGWAAALEKDAARCHAQSRLSLPRIGPLALAPLAEAGFAALVIKGAALTGRYPDADLRPMDDVDLILPTEQIDPAVAALRSAGWTALPQRRPHEIDLTHPALPGMPIDLHRGLAWWRSRANRLTSDHLWEARQPITLHDAPAFALPPEVELVMLAAHAAKPFHVFGRLVWSVDIAMVVSDAESRGGVDWDEVARLASDTRCPTAVAVALCQAELLGVESPAALRRVPGGPRRAAELAPVLSPDWPVATRDSAVRANLRYALVDERSAKVTLAVSDIVGKGAVGALPRATVLATRLVRRGLRRLRGAAPRSDGGREKARDLVEP